MKIVKASLDASDKSFAIVVSRFNDFISVKLLEGALDCLQRHNADDKKITVVWVPGSFEIPLAAQKLAAGKKFDALICLGAVIKGETSHNEYIANEVIKGIAQIGLQIGVPVVLGVITPDNLEQAIERAGTKLGNKGFDAAMTAIEMANLVKMV
jgi:6,7-dimethyl-8-ribityllumazine synthase